MSPQGAPERRPDKTLLEGPGELPYLDTSPFIMVSWAPKWISDDDDFNLVVDPFLPTAEPLSTLPPLTVAVWDEWTNFTVNLTSNNNISLAGNDSGINGEAAEAELETIWVVLTIVTALLLGFIILTTIIGNVFVIAAILLERNLQSVANYLILSLAVADLLVAALVMPLGAVYEVSKEWTLGAELCDLWTAIDVLCCTASILHLVAIALDRFWAVTNLDYIQTRSPHRVRLMIGLIWIVSLVISAAPMMGWKDPDWHNRLDNKLCLVSQDVGYQIFATMTSFYVPLGIILFLYWRIFLTARRRIRKRKKAGSNILNALSKGPVAISETTTFSKAQGNQANQVNQLNPVNQIKQISKATNGASQNGIDREESSTGMIDCVGASSLVSTPTVATPKQNKMVKASHRKERKAAKTLAIITGVFIMCWLPFFIVALLMPLCPETCDFNPYMIATFLWLGYFNSTLNPIIYTIFSPDFRNAFKRILCGRKRRFARYSSRLSSARFLRNT